MSTQKPDDVHVYPLNDSAPHRLTPECWCDPEELEVNREGFVQEGRAKIWLHKSADGREIAEDEASDNLQR